MDLGLQGRKAIVSAAGKGLGKACARSLRMAVRPDPAMGVPSTKGTL